MEAKPQTFNCGEISGGIATEVFSCPSCNIKLQMKDVAAHCEIEIEHLRKMHANESTVGEALEPKEQRKPYNIFQRVQMNRQTRLKQRSRKRATPPVTADAMCPICNKNFSPTEIQLHAEKCLRKSNGLNTNGIDEHSSNDEDDAEDGGEEEYEEYEWAGQKRVRASSLLQGGYASIGIGQTISYRNNEDDDDEDLNVDEDDTQIYGPPQYDEADVIPTKSYGNCNSKETDIQEENVTSYVRSLITGGTKNNVQCKQSQDAFTDDDATLSNESSLNCQPCSSTSVLASSSITSQQIIDSLKTKIRQYENHAPAKYKCLICLDDYRNPAISVACWHVHCEECWLRSLGTRKLCPQCNLITSPKDLRRIYL